MYYIAIIISRVLYDTQGTIRNPLENTNAMQRQVGMVISSIWILQQPLFIKKIQHHLCNRGTYRWTRVSRSPCEAGHSRVALQNERKDNLYALFTPLVV